MEHIFFFYRNVAPFEEKFQKNRLHFFSDFGTVVVWQPKYLIKPVICMQKPYQQLNDTVASINILVKGLDSYIVYVGNSEQLWFSSGLYMIWYKVFLDWLL